MYVTGGNIDGARSKSVVSYAVQSNTFAAMVDMNRPRSSHCSAIAGKKLYVVGSVGTDGDSIEVLDLSDVNAVWQLIQSPVFTQRYSPCVVALSSLQLLIMGGSSSRFESDILML